MEHFKGTPGPWRANTFLVTAENGRQVTHVGLLGRRKSSFSDRDGGDEDVTNAILIAAAPDMLEAMASAITTLAELNPHFIPTSYETPTEQHRRECVTDAYHTLLAAYDLAIKGPSQ